MTEYISTGAELSPDGRYRFELSRYWEAGLPTAVFVMLNPSTADADEDDPTIRRCVGFAQREGCGGLTVVNLFAYRATDPKHLKSVADPTGPDNAVKVGNVVGGATGPVICAWGAHKIVERSGVARALKNHDGTVCLGVTANGSPRHPLYVKGDAPLVPWPAS